MAAWPDLLRHISPQFHSIISRFPTKGRGRSRRNPFPLPLRPLVAPTNLLDLLVPPFPSLGLSCVQSACKNQVFFFSTIFCPLVGRQTSFHADFYNISIPLLTPSPTSPSERPILRPRHHLLPNPTLSSPSTSAPPFGFSDAP